MSAAFRSDPSNPSKTRDQFFSYRNVLPLRTQTGVSINVGEFGLIFSINIPDDLYRQAQEIAEAHHISLEQVFTSAVMSTSYL